MKYIITKNQGIWITVEDVLFDWLNDFEWRAVKSGKETGYTAARTDEDGELIYMDRFIVGLSPNDSRRIKHLNHDGRHMLGGNLVIWPTKKAIKNLHWR